MANYANGSAQPQQKFEEQKGKFGMPKCPYCGKKINPIYAWGIKSKGEYHCSECGTFANIKLEKFVYAAGLAALIIEALLLLLFIFTGGVIMYLLPLMIVPFLVFTCLAPFGIRFEKIGITQKRKGPHQAPPQGAAGHRTATAEMKAVKKENPQDFSIEKDTTLQFQKMKNKDHPKRIDDTKH